ncbi:tripartite tricarboxylate transporter TctB family protein [Noviherbaspirillum sp.]|uniref:tripartite tricarboxylate transporter TctB family protein n=1 Tax=Noviherbaspirillum sp. TaxID=1926288 RepID=UPI002D596AC8|nr:tripartite tricarboxylate transporter TctB family protein [Noviherbaspirillum sp.]HZW21543.1 tripartite tricarboxylate transporter TctB family protein [Noviherbaspirillum sp.]
MPSFIRGPKDFWSGVIFVIFGLAAVIIGRDYSMGTAGRMGPAYFPTILGGLLTLIGLIGVVRSMVRTGSPIGRFAIREILLVLFSVVVFGLLVRGAGLALSVVLVVVISGIASTKFKLGPYVLLGVGMSVFCVLLFVKALGLPMPMFGPWLGF